MRTIVLTNQKGGVGKSTAAVNIAFGLAFAGNKTLLVDTDPQANSSVVVLGGEKPQLTIYDLLVRDAQLDQVVSGTRVGNLDVLPSEKDLSGAEVELIGEVGSQTLLRSKIDNANFIKKSVLRVTRYPH